MNRAADVVLASLGLALTSPLLGAAALVVKLEDGGPILYRQRRVGKDGEEFELLKVRTMVVGAEKLGAGYAVDKGDSRITRAGRVLRRLSIDELPQLWNVVRGDMSVIGPRPTLGYQVERYTPQQRRRLEVKPGVTGWAQIHGRAGLPWGERIVLDVWYVDHRSPRLELEILARTPLALLTGTYKGATGGWHGRDALSGCQLHAGRGRATPTAWGRRVITHEPPAGWEVEHSDFGGHVVRHQHGEETAVAYVYSGLDRTWAECTSQLRCTRFSTSPKLASMAERDSSRSKVP